jgi:quinolinate synthase
MDFSQEALEQESKRLFQVMSPICHKTWSLEKCRELAPKTLEINTLKKEQNAVILGHFYQSPDIVFGVSDHVGDSYGLSVLASKLPEQKIIFSSVHFMGETAKLLNPEKEVLVPTYAGCSLADSITAEDVRELKKKYPGIPVICYVNTSAEVKAECDICCTSANVVEIVENTPGDTVIFLPDFFMGENLKKMTKKKIITWDKKDANGKPVGICIVHDEFTPAMVQDVRQMFPGVTIMAHPECSPSVIEQVDVIGGTNKMMNFVEKNPEKNQYMLITECGITDAVKQKYPDKDIRGTCSLCPYMRKIVLDDILVALKNPRPDQIINIPEKTAEKARECLDKMFELVG